MANECHLLWEIDDQESERSKLVGYPIYDMKCNVCLTFIGCANKPEDIESSFCPHCGAKIIKKDKCYG
jgi:hypothetical protein